MEWLNYHHLLYFWTVAKLGSIRAASEQLNLSQPALSTQIRQLENSFEEKLFEKRGRGLKLTMVGSRVYRYADEIFSLGRELQSELKGRPTGRPWQLTVGITDVLSKLVVHRILRSALTLEQPLRLSCREATLQELIQALLNHEMDMVLSDLAFPAPRLYSHLLRECELELLAAPCLLKRHKGPFPAGLEGAPMLLPSEGCALRRNINAWLVSHDLHPVVAGDFDDSALLKAFGAAGEGFFVAPASVAQEVAKMYGVKRLGKMEGLKERVYAIVVKRKVAHPAVQAILKAVQGA